MRHVLYALLGGIAVVCLILAFLAFRYFEPAIGFTYYEPTYLPAHVSITAKRIDIIHGGTTVEQNFRTEDWVYEIREQQAGYATTIGTADQNYDSKSAKPTCVIRLSPQKTQYRLCHWIDYGRIDVHEIKFTKNNTFINAQIPTDPQQPLTLQDTDKFVDSFRQRSTIGIPVSRCDASIC